MKGLKNHLIPLAGIAFIALAIAGLAFLAGPAHPAAAAPLPQDGGLNNAACLGCHSAPDQTIQLPSGETLVITIDETMFGQSVHSGLTCNTCHTDITAFPHPEKTTESVRSYELKYSQQCKSCHADQYEQLTDSIHGQKLADANNPNCTDCANAPVCADCHNPHTQQQVRDANGQLLQSVRFQVPTTCAKCHNGIFEEYKNSVHGAGILEENNPDVATCTDCHGVHTISDPTKAAFRNSSTLLCANCHTDKAKMDKYGISTNVLNTYVADFHGTTVTLFEKQSPDDQTNKAVCYDCHGIHTIKKVDDPTYGLAIKENMLAACKRCHPDATQNFPASWLSHYNPTPTKYALVYYVGLFYKILIPLVLGVMVLLILTDIAKKTVFRKRGGNDHAATTPTSGESPKEG